MTEDAFRAYLATRLGPDSARSYLSNVRSVERILGVDLDTLVLTDDAVNALLMRVRETGAPAATVSNYGSALRAYAAHTAPPSKLNIVATAKVIDKEADRLSTRAFEDATPAIPLPALSISQLMKQYASILTELRHRNVARTANGPIGDYAEMLFSQAFGWTLAGNSEAGYDAQDLAGTRFQIKARRLSKPESSRQLGALRRLPEKHFDILAAVLFDADVSVFRAILIPYEIVVENARRVEHTNSWRLMLYDKLCMHPAVVDVSRTIRRAAEA